MTGGSEQVSIGEIGEVLHYDEEEGYGFLSTDHPEVKDDVYVHISDLKYERLLEGEDVYYRLYQNSRGYHAKGVVAVDRDLSRECRGEVEFYNPDKSYGFISDTSNVCNEVFVHLNDVDAERLHEGDSVVFNTVSGDEGPVAKHVRVKNASPPPSRNNPATPSKEQKDTAEMTGERSVPDGHDTAKGSTSGTGAHSNGPGDPTNKNKLLNGDQ